MSLKTNMNGSVLIFVLVLIMSSMIIGFLGIRHQQMSIRQSINVRESYQDRINARNLSEIIFWEKINNQKNKLISSKEIDAFVYFTEYYGLYERIYLKKRNFAVNYYYKAIIGSEFKNYDFNIAFLDKYSTLKIIENASVEGDIIRGYNERNNISGNFNYIQNCFLKYNSVLDGSKFEIPDFASTNYLQFNNPITIQDEWISNFLSNDYNESIIVCNDSIIIALDREILGDVQLISNGPIIVKSKSRIINTVLFSKSTIYFNGTGISMVQLMSEKKCILSSNSKLIAPCTIITYGYVENDAINIEPYSNISGTVILINRSKKSNERSYVHIDSKFCNGLIYSNQGVNIRGIFSGKIITKYFIDSKYNKHEINILRDTNLLNYKPKFIPLFLHMNVSPMINFTMHHNK